MPVLGAIGNASEYSFRGTYDNYPLDIDFVDLTDAEIQSVYYTSAKLIQNINYKVPVSISGGEYTVSNILFDKVFGNKQILFADRSTLFGTNFTPQYYEFYSIGSSDYWRSDSSYIRNANTIALRIIAIPPVTIQSSIPIVDRSLTQYNISLSTDLNLTLRSGTYTYNTGGSLEFQNRTIQGSEIGTEYYGKSYSTTVTIGKKEFTWNVTTKQAGVPENFSFVPLTDQTFSTDVTSSSYIVSGLTDAFNYTAEITSTEGLLSVNYGDFVRSSIVKNGDNVRLKVTSSDTLTTTKTVGLKISVNGIVGSATTNWTVTTLDNVPTNLSFNDATSAELKSDIFSNVAIISGLSSGIDFNVSVTSNNGTLSVNGGAYVSSTTIKNGDTLQLKTTTSSIWSEQKTIRVRLETTETSWIVTNRTINANSDSFASNLIYSIPFETINQVKDVSPEVRLSSSLSAGLRANSRIASFSGSINPTISTEQTKYYLSSLKLAKGTTTRTFEVPGIRIGTTSTESLGYSDFTIELWMRFSGFSFGGENGMSIFYPSYTNSKNPADYFFQLYLKGDNWPNVSQFRRGLWFGLPDITTGAVSQPLMETSYQVFTTNTWHHIALTRVSNTFYMWVDGSNVAAVTRSVDLTSSGYNFALPNFQRLTADDVYIQDLRLYKGVSKYTSRFNTSNVTSIMEPYNSSSVSGDFYVDSAGRILILSCATPGKDPKTLTKTTGKVLTGTNTCIDDARWQNFLTLARNTDGYRLTATLDNSTSRITTATDNNIRRMLNANVLPLQTSLTAFDSVNGNLAWDETSGADITGSDYSLLNWTTAYNFGYYGQSSNPFFNGFTFGHTTANWWILPPGVPDF